MHALKPFGRNCHCLFRFADVAAGLLQLGQNIFDAIGDQAIDPRRARQKFLRAHVFDQRQKRIPVAVDVGDQDRLFVPPELRPRHLLDELFESADAAG